ncbi:MAG TPA: GNAT family N-acetyltransferase [Kofleriaceae bacterium]|nr:GNAT family N-acetyltransferase [Kofleriaceae bacterium]
MTVRDRLRRKLERLRDQLARDDLDRTGRALHIVERSLMAARLYPAVSISHERFYELTSAPRQFRGLRDLRVRPGTPDDAASITALDGTPPWRIAERFTRGDLAYVADHDGRLLAHSWFHRGPEPFDEDLPLLPRLDVPADAFWSYNAFTVPEARASGVFVKLFQTALRELLVDRGAARVRCRIKAANAASISLHERFGFAPLGTLIALSVPGARLLSWDGRGRARLWIERRDGSSVMALPPEEVR